MTMDLHASQCLALPRASLAALRAALVRDTGGGFATYLQEAGYAGGEAVFGAFKSWLAARGEDVEALDLDAFQSRGAEFFREAGWGSLTISPVGDVVAMVDSTDWAEADPVSAMPYPSCHYTTGMLADFFGRTAAAPLAVLEVECRSAGSPHCRFLVGATEVMGHLYERMAAGESYEAAAQALA
jgi:predicted hydrocarbon binding protein